jgi:hypothetical protein
MHLENDERIVWVHEYVGSDKRTTVLWTDKGRRYELRYHRGLKPLELTDDISWETNCNEL